MSIRRLSGTSKGVSLRCRGCASTATADQFTADRLAQMIGWRRDDDGDWCVRCQWQRGRRPDFVARLVSRGRP